MAKKFDPEGTGYDMESAKKAGMKADETGHWGSRDPKSGLILKGRKHPTFHKTVAADKKMGYEMKKVGERYYSFKKDNGFYGHMSAPKLGKKKGIIDCLK